MSVGPLTCSYVIFTNRAKATRVLYALLIQVFVLRRISKLREEVPSSTFRRVQSTEPLGYMDISGSRIDAHAHPHQQLENSPAVLHQYNFALIGTLGILLQVKQAAGSPSPFVTDLVTMLMFIAVFWIYICSLATVKTYHFPTPDLSEFMYNISLLFGSLASILLLLILVPAFGFFLLSLWIVYFLIDFVTKKSYRNALGYFWDKVKELFKGQVKHEPENVVGLQEAGEQTAVGQLPDTQEITER